MRVLHSVAVVLPSSLMARHLQILGSNRQWITVATIGADRWGWVHRSRSLGSVLMPWEGNVTSKSWDHCSNQQSVLP